MGRRADGSVRGGADGLRKRLEAEGHQVVTRGRRLVVEGYESRLAFRE